MLKNICKSLVKAARRIPILRIGFRLFSNSLQAMYLAQLRTRLWGKSPDSVVRCLGYKIRITDGPNYYMQYKDILVHRIYHFEATRPDPIILDAGGNMGMSLLYFKHIYPLARVVSFEPDPAVFDLLKENVNRNGFNGVELVNAALSSKPGTAHFTPDQSAGGHLSPGEGTFIVKTVPLSDYLKEPVDLLKMNIEGVEWEVISSIENKIRQVREMIIEYHHLPGLKRTLHLILELLHRHGFEYMINDFDSETNSGVKTPFHLDQNSSYFLLVYAKRID